MASKIESRVVLFIGGEVYNYKEVSKLITNTDYFIAVDSGYRHCKVLGVTPEIIIGDFDSIEGSVAGIPTLSLPTSKNYTDFYHALEYTLEQGAREILTIGGLGGRFDHTLANIQACVWASSNANIALFDGNTAINIINAEYSSSFILQNQPGYYFSVIAHTNKAASVTIKNARYPLDNYNLSNTDPRGVSNEFAGKDVHISCKSGILLIISCKMG